jgi:signal transduction histidine kinase
MESIGHDANRVNEDGARLAYSLYRPSDSLMSSAPIRGRIAPTALLVALAFVVVGVLRADREMIRSEKDRASLVLSETATLVEVFLLRHLTELRTAERIVDARWLDSTWVADSLPVVTRRFPDIAAGFDALWIGDTTLSIRSSVALRKGMSVPPIGATIVTRPRPSGTSLRDSDVHSGNRPEVQVYEDQGQRSLLFIESVYTPIKATLVGATSIDSLSALLQSQQRAKAFGILIQASSDTILDVSATPPEKGSRTLKQAITTPFSGQWTITMTYVPSGRGVRIALWVVGLGAIVGLGIGLLLERREARRIADRSSELEHLSAELLRANRAKSEFLANVSHELRTPLNAIVGFVDLLRDGVYGALNSRQVGPVERIEASANHLRHLVDQVLDLAKMAAGRLEVHAEPLELRPFVFDVASEVEPLITEKGLGFSLAIGASLPRVRTDPTHLRQILINLLGNAVKFTSNGGISIRGKLIGIDEQEAGSSIVRTASALLARSPRPDGVWIALQVADSGIGIPDKDRDRIFDEFEQVNAGPRGDSMRRGTGLGLSISRRLARLIGGDLTVESELGRGSVFTVWLPVNPADLQGDRAA